MLFTDEHELLRKSLQLRLPLPRRERFAVQVVKDLAGPDRALFNLEIAAITLNGNRIGGVGLQFHRISTGFGGCVNKPKRLLFVLIMIRRKLGDDISRMSRPDLSSVNLDRLDAHRTFSS